MKSNLLKAERIKIGITQKNISEYLNIDVSTYSKKENGLIEFKASEIRLLKKVLDLTPQKISEIFFEN
ncbi:helix-turn-helix transcriptional regulator [Clostridium sp. NSJ-6]|uniref:Helix-turn-helix transcriptional regulator n=1 Tax=Clostridium hominis TaxID=2763036 RepID=A0ABR7D853_9CLOT|nr:helix-turn-helix transcriptional regulator [Clostridium hominis]MBC5627559.1 helix-turn-helix transcriptional regulator [Clostridium hominis]